MRIVEVQQPAQRAVANRRLLLLRIHLVRAPVLVAHRVLQVRNCAGHVHVRLPAVPPVVLSRFRQPGALHCVPPRVPALVHRERVLRNVLESHALDARRRPREAPVHDAVVHAERLEDLRAFVAGQRRDAHLGHHLEDAVVDGRLVVVEDLLRGEALERIRPAPCACTPCAIAQQPLRIQRAQRLHRQVRVHRVHTVPDEAAEVVHLARLCRLDDDRHLRSLLLAHQVVVHGARRNKRRERHPRSARRAVAQHNHLAVVHDRLRRLLANSVDRLCVSCQAVSSSKRDINVAHVPVRVHLLNAPDRAELCARQNRRAQLEPVALRGLHRQQVALRAHIALERHHYALADRVNGWVCHLRKEFPEIVVD